MVFVGFLVAAVGLHVRAAPAQEPWLVRPVSWGLLAACPSSTATALATGIIPGGAAPFSACLLGGATALGWSPFLWQHFPEGSGC